jgi:long-chain fatty acid transport protein
MRKIRGGALVACVAIALAQPTAAKAGGFYVREHSTAAMGSAFAGAAAYGHDASYLFYNPAAIADLTGTVVTLDGRVFFPNVSIHATEATSPSGTNLLPLGDSGSMADDASAPAVYATHQVDAQTTLGIGFSGPFAVIIQTRPQWAGEYQLLKTSMVSWNLTPTVARRVNDRFAFAFGLNVQGMDVDLQRRESFLFFSGPGFLRGNDIAVGWNAGLTWDPLPGTRVGLSYRSQITHHLNGTAGIKGLPFTQNVSFNLSTPTVISAGIEQSITERLTLLGEVDWNDWSAFDGFRIKFDSGLFPTVVRPQVWKDTWFFSLGGRYQVLDRTSVSAGIGYEQSVSVGGSNTINPDGDRTILGLGFTHECWRGITLAASYAHIWFADGAIDVASPRGTLKATMKNDLDIVGVSLTGQW